MKILLVGFQKVGGMMWFLDKTLNKMGHSSEAFCYRTISQKIMAQSLVSTAFRHAPIANKIYLHKMNNELSSLIRKNNYDLIIVLKGETVFPKTIRLAKKSGSKIVNWFMDPMLRLETGYLFNVIGEYDYFFVKDLFIKQRMNELGFDNVKFLLEAFDPEIFRKLNSGEKNTKYKSEIAFVGNIYPYRQLLLKSFKGYDFKAWGQLVNVARNDVKWFYQGRTAVSEEANQIFNNGKVVFNSHTPWEISGSNVRLFEICGSGAFQLTDTTLYTNKIFRINREIACYNDLKELKEKVDYYLRKENKEERRKIAERGYIRAINDHTYEKRVNELFKLIKIKNK